MSDAAHRSPEPPAPQPTSPEPTPGQRAGLISLAVAAFACVTTETLPIGLLPQISRAFSVNESTTGHLVSLYAGVVMLLAVPMTLATRRIPGKHLLVTTMAGFAVCNLLAALAPGFGILALARGLAGVLHAVFFSVCIGYASRLVPPDRTGRAMALVSAGISAGLILGSPLATVLGDALGWRAAFGVLVLLTLVSVVLMVRRLPGRALTSAGAGDRRPAGRRRDAAVVILANMLTYIGQFTLYTYITVILLTSGAPRASIGPLLALFGLCGLLCIWRAASLLDRSPRRAAVILLGGTVLGVLGVGLSMPVLALVILAGVVWNGAFGPIASLYQSATVRTDGVGPEIAGAWINATANVGISLGALIGGAVLDHLAVRDLAWVAALPIGAALVVVLLGRGGFPGRAGDGPTAAGGPTGAGAGEPAARIER